MIFTYLEIVVNVLSLYKTSNKNMSVCLSCAYSTDNHSRRPTEQKLSRVSQFKKYFFLLRGRYRIFLGGGAPLIQHKQTT